MLKVGQLLKFVSDMNPQNTPARLSFFNYLRGFPSVDSDLTPDIIQGFFNYSMDYPHWVGNRQQLSRETQFLLDNFNSLYQKKFDTSTLKFPLKMQIVEIDDSSDLLEAINVFLKRQCAVGEKFRVLFDQNKRVVAILLRKDKTLEVRTYDKKFTIRNGHLEPLRNDLVLYYTSNLELSPNHTHKIEVAPYITAQFNVQNEKVTGVLLRGYVFQKLAEFKNDPLQEQTRLLFPIKRLEQFFVDRRTDPYYQDLISQLERTCSLVQQGDKEATKWATIVLNKAEMALDNVFLGDKFMTLLARDLRHALTDYNRKNISSGNFNNEILIAQHLPEVEEECLKITPITGLDSIN